MLGLVPREQDGAVAFDLPDGAAFAVQSTQDLEPAERTVGFLVDDLDDAVEHLRSAGVATDEVSDSETRRWVHRAPDGRLYELVQSR